MTFFRRTDSISQFRKWSLSSYFKQSFPGLLFWVQLFHPSQNSFSELTSRNSSFGLVFGGLTSHCTSNIFADGTATLSHRDFQHLFGIGIGIYVRKGRCTETKTHCLTGLKNDWRCRYLDTKYSLCGELATSHGGKCYWYYVGRRNCTSWFLSRRWYTSWMLQISRFVTLVPHEPRDAYTISHLYIYRIEWVYHFLKNMICRDSIFFLLCSLQVRL